MPRRQRQSRRALKNRKRTQRKRTQRGGAPAKLVLGLLAIFKNEAMGIREWVDHYKKQGYDYIILLDNDSTDAYREKLKGTEGFVHVLPTPGRHKQNEYYNSIGRAKAEELGVNVLTITDLDEFIYVKDGRPLRNYIQAFFGPRLNGQPGPSGFQLGWTLFGSSGHEKQPESIRKGFTWRKKESTKEPDVKSTVWLADVKPGDLDLHSTRVVGEYVKYPPELQLNHYIIQSKEFYDTVKRTRGDALVGSSDTMRNDEYFQRFDSREYEDTELKTYVEQGKA
jgi:hypothetical protein